jgi:hypothetical protein
MVDFNWDLLQTSDYKVITREHYDIIIGGINIKAKDGHQIVGWIEIRGAYESYAWDLTGKLYGWHGTDYPYDLFLTKI